MNKYLSRTYYFWYSRLYTDLKLNIQLESLLHPHMYLVKNPIVSAVSPCKLSINAKIDARELADNQLVTNSNFLFEYLKTHLAKIDLHSYIQLLPNVSSNRVYSECSKTKPKILIIDEENAFVIVKVENIIEYVDNYYTIQNLFSKNPSVIKHIGVFRSGENYYFFSEYKGYDYETLILDFHLNDLKQELSELFYYIERNSMGNVFLRNNAPRNIISASPNTSYLIDFDHVYPLDTTTPIQLYIKMLEKRVWYADIFDFTLIDKTLNTLDIAINKEQKVRIGSFEKAYYGTSDDFLSLREYEYTFYATYRLEHLDIFDNKSIYGHELGRFISDCWSLENEVNLSKFISGIEDEQLKILRHNLFLLSRIDQELLFRKSYGLDMDKKLLSEKYFTSIIDVDKTINILQATKEETEDMYEFYDLYNKLSI